MNQRDVHGAVDVVVTRTIPDPGLPLLREAGLSLRLLDQQGAPTREVLLAAVPGCRALLSLLTDRVDADLMDAAGPSLKVVANYAVGVDNVDVSAATERGIAVANTPGVLTNASAELAIVLMLAAARRVTEADRFVREGRFTGWDPGLLRGMELRGKTIGIVGAGRIGHATAELARGLKMRVVYHHHRPDAAFERDLGATWLSLDELLATADVVSLHVPLRDSTRHLIGAAQLALMKPTAVLVNTARGPIVDEAALVQALRNGTIGAAGLDVYEHEPALAPGLADLPNTVLLPHLGSATVETRAAMANLAATAVVDVLAGRRPANLVDDDVWAHRRQP
jgi:glyoxylate reductase